MITQNDFIEIKTIDNTRVRVQKSNIGAIEEIPATARTEGYVKIYIEGFSFNVRLSIEEVFKLIEAK